MPDPAHQDRIIIEDYDPRWPDRFARETARLRPILGEAAKLEHFGSTAVPGLAAKPVIDILAGIDGDLTEKLQEQLMALGYTFSRKNADWWAFFRKGMPRTHHLHIIDLSREEGRLHWQKELGFRNALRKSQKLRTAYETLKHGLANRFSNDRPSYEAGKTDFITDVVRGDRPQ